MHRSLDHESVSGRPPVMRETLTETGKLGLRLLEDLTSLAAGGSVCAYLELFIWNYLLGSSKKKKKIHFVGISCLWVSRNPLGALIFFYSHH